jgi:D-lactate dehydrogenase
MKIVVFEADPGEAPCFDTLKGPHEVLLVGAPLRSDNASQFRDAAVVSTFYSCVLDRGVLEQFPSLKLVATRSTGFDHIDLAYCRSRGIAVSNVPNYGESTVAEHVFALLLAISRHLPAAIEHARRGQFSPEGLLGFDLAGKTLGVIGTGHIGRHVVRIAKGFEMEVVAFDVDPDPACAAALGFRYAALDDLLAVSDVITLHVPSRPDTRHLIAGPAFSRMKQGAVLINTARGDVVDAEALIAALTSGRLAAAGLDVLPDEPLIRGEAAMIASIFRDPRDLRNLVADHVLLRMPNVIVTPHVAFHTREALARIVETTVENIRSFLAGTPQNLVVGASVPA